MSRIKIMNSRRFYFISMIVWFVLCALHFVIRTKIALAHPDHDLYVNTWMFQFLVFLILILPIWIVALLAILYVERWLISRQRNEPITPKET